MLHNVTGLCTVMSNKLSFVCNRVETHANGMRLRKEQ